MSGVAKFIGTVAGIAALIPGPHQPIAAAVAVAANVTAQLTAKKPPAMSGSVNRITLGANQPKPYLIGETYYGGNRINQEGFGGKVSKVNNPYMVLVDVYSGAGPVAGFVAPYLDFVPVTLNGNAATGYAANHLYVYHQLGRTPETAALSTHWGGSQTWGPQHKLSSYAAISWCLRFDEDGKRFAAGVPQTGAVWRGVLCYDPRKDSTYPGGSGPHRWADPTDTAAFAAAKATWEWSRCPGLHGLRYALGTWERDEANPDARYRKTFGPGIPIDGIRVADFVALANVCDANGWKVDGVIHEPGNRDDNMKNILAAGGAERCWIGGKLGLKLSAPRVALDTITEYDLATDEVEVGAMQGWESRLNTIVPKYRSADHKWEYVPSTAVTIASYLAEDGEEKAEERQYNLVQSKDQAAQLAAYELLDARELGEIVLTCKPRLRRYGAGDLLIVHLPDDGLVNQPCVVLKRTVDPVNMTVELILRGETAAKHDFALGRTGVAPATPRLIAGDVFDGVAVDVPVQWDAVTGPGRPTDNADVTADNISKDTAAIGGRPVGNVLATLDAIEPIAETYADLLDDVSALANAKVGTDAALGALDRAAGNSRAALAQVERDAGRIGETLLRLLAESERTRTVLRDAGIVVDPTTGVVRIYAVDQIAERTASAEVRLDAATATISSKASVAYVQEQIALAVLDPGQAAQLEPIIARLTSAEQTISGVEASVSSKAELIELTRVSGRVTTVSENLDALAGTVSTKASRTDLDAQGARLGSVEETLATLDGVSSFGVTVRQARTIADGAAEAGLRALLAGDKAHRWQIVQQAEGRTEMFAKLADQSSAEAVARQVLSVKIGAIDARGIQESVARIAGDEALSTRINALSASNGELAAAIGTLESASVEQGKGFAGIMTTIRQQVADDETTGEALLRALIAGDQTGRRRAGQLVQVQTELSTTLVANEQAAALARQSLLVRMASAEAAIVTTSRALATLTQSIVERVTAAEAVILDPVTGLVATRAEIVEIDRLSADRDKALGERIDVVSVSAGDAEAAVSKLATVVADGDEANAKLVEQVTAKLGDLGEATVQDLIEAAVTETGKILARRTVTVDVNGNLTGFALIGSEDGPGNLNLINTDLRMGTGRVVFDNGSAMRAQGNGFGKNRDLISWFGPSMPLDECTRANATSFEGTDGRAYFGGGLSAGIDKNAVQTSNTAADASVTTGPLASKGRRRTIVLSYVYSRFAQLNSGTANDRGASGATIELYRGSVRIITLSASGEWVRTRYSGASQPATYSEDLSGSITVNDDSGGTTVEYTARLISRSLGPGVSGSPVSDTVGQNISIIQTEE